LKKLIIFLFIVAAIAVTILIVLKVTVNDLKKEDIVENLNKIIVDGSDSLYSLTIRDYEVTGSFNGARINGVEVTINQDVFKKMQTNNTLPEVIFDGKVENILLEGINILKLVQDNKDIKIKSIDLIGADFNIYQYKKTVKDTTKAPIITNLYDRIKKDIHSISIGKINIVKGKMSYDPAGKLDKKKPFWKFAEIDLKFKDLLVDSTSASDTTRFIYSKEFKTAIRNFKGIMGNDMYTFSVEKCDYDHKSSYLEIANLKMTPNASHAAFYRSKNHAVSEATIDVPFLQVKGIRSVDIINKGLVKAKSISIRGAKFGIYKDKSFGDPPDSKNGSYPNQTLYNLPFALDIRELIIKKSTLVYTEKGFNTKKEGILTFGNINGTMTNITNVKSLVRQNPWSELNAKATFQGASPMTARLAFDLRDDKGRYEADATLTKLKAEQINPVIKNLGMAETESFNLKSLNYTSKGDAKTATGSMELIYSDLKVNIFQKDEETKKLEEKKVISFLANLIKVRTNNLKDKDEVKAVNIVSERPFFKGFFALIWFNIFDCTTAIAFKGKAPDILKKGRTLEGIPGGGVKKASSEEKKALEDKADQQKKDDKKDAQDKAATQKKVDKKIKSDARDKAKIDNKKAALKVKEGKKAEELKRKEK